MKKKHPPEQYAAKPKVEVVKPIAAPVAHPSLRVAKALVDWMDRGGVPPSIILLHGLHFARSAEIDDIPVDTLRPLLKMQGTEGKAISEIMDALARPQAHKIQIIAAWLQSVWVKKLAAKPRLPSTQNERRKSTASNAPKKTASPPRKARPSIEKKPVVVVIKKSQGRDAG